MQERNASADDYLRLRQLLTRLRRTEDVREKPRLGPKDFFTLHLIRHLSPPERPGVQMSALARELEISLPALSKTVQSLEERGYVLRVPDPRSRRNTLVQLTQKGVELELEEDRRSAEFAQRVFSRMGRKDVEEFYRICTRLVEIAEEESVKIRKELEQTDV